MSIAEFIRESVLRPRLKQAGCLVVYDADKRYREQCFDLAADKVRVIDTSESSIESREDKYQASENCSCRAGAPRCLNGHKALKPGIGSRGRIQHRCKLLELVSIQAKKDLIQHHGLRSVASSFEHEVRTVLAEQAGSLIDQVALLGQGPQVDGGVTHGMLILHTP